MKGETACFLVCENGLGHLRRVAQVVGALLGRVVSLQVKIVCAPWQVAALHRWPAMKLLLTDARVTFDSTPMYPRWSDDPGYFLDERLLSWHETLRPLELQRYNLVVSDNLVEVLCHAPNAVLMGSFLWHDLLEAKRPEPITQRYAAWCLSLLREHQPPMIANRYFAMPAVRQQTRIVEVGMLPSALRSGDATTTWPSTPGLLFIGGTSVHVSGALVRCLGQHADRHGLPVRLFADSRLHQRLPPDSPVQSFDLDADELTPISAVIARPGLGITTDCVASGKPLFCYHEGDAEMVWNAQRLEALGLGRTLDGLDDMAGQVLTFLDDRHLMARYREAVSQIDHEGLTQTVDHLCRHTGWE